MPISDLNNVQELWFLNMDADGLIQSDLTEPFAFSEGINSIPAGAGAGVFSPPAGTTNGHPGVWSLLTGTSAAGRVFLLSRVGAYMVGVGGVTRFAAWVQPPVLSTALERFTLRAGFFAIALPNIIVQGIGFEYNDAENGGRWQAITDDGAETSVDTGIDVVAGDWYKLEWLANADGTEIEYFINDEPVGRITTTLPTGLGFVHFVNIHIMKLIGTGNRAFFVDAYAVFQDTQGRD